MFRVIHFDNEDSDDDAQYHIIYIKINMENPPMIA